MSDKGEVNPIGWAFVYRGTKEVATFPTFEMADGWKHEAPHRRTDIIRTKMWSADLNQCVRKHLPALRAMAKQIIDPKDNVFAKMVKDFEEHL